MTNGIYEKLAANTICNGEGLYAFNKVQNVLPKGNAATTATTTNAATTSTTTNNNNVKSYLIGREENSRIM